MKDEEEQEDDAASSRVVSSSRLERASHSLDSEATTSTRLGFSRLRRSLSARHRHRTEPAVQVSGNSLEDINKVPSAEESEAFSVAKYSLLGRSEDSSSDDSELTFGALGSECLCVCVCVDENGERREGEGKGREERERERMASAGTLLSIP